ncbi:hypothetical protein ACQY0O_005376 [Thecaphora frezii]
MKRFFSRFSTTGTSPAPVASPAPFDQSWEKKELPDGFAPPKTPHSGSRSTGKRVKALAAKYEAQTLRPDDAARTASEPAQAQKALPALPNLEPLPDLSTASAAAARQAAAPVAPPPKVFVSARHIFDRPPASRPDGLGLAAVSDADHSLASSGRGQSATSQRAPSAPDPSEPAGTDAIDDRSTTPGSSEERRTHVEQRQPSASSQGSANSGPKSVAFAPSPEKPSHAVHHGHIALLPRSASPARAAAATATSSEGVSRTSAPSTEAGGGLGFTGNFARPTVASQARARSSGRPGGSDGSAWNGTWSATTSPTSERPPTLATAARPAKMNRTNSLQSSSRRQAAATVSGGGGGSGGSNAEQSEGPSFTISSPTMIGSPASLSSSSFGHGSPHRRSSLEANSIPFAGLGQGTHPTVRSISPVSIGTHTSVPMQITGSAGSSSGHTGRPDSRGPSVATAPYGSWRDGQGFQFGSLGHRQHGVPSWSEMTHAELVHNLGPRERTRQEVLWEIVASEERYVAELEKVKELYIDALLHPDRFDPDRLLSQDPASSSSVPLADDLSQLDFGGSGNGSGNAAQRSSRRDLETPSEATVAAASAFTSASADLPIAARFMSATASVVRSEDDAAGSVSGHGLSLYPKLDAAAQAQVDSQRAAGNRSPYSAGLLNAASSIGATASSQLQPDSRRNSLTGSGGGSGGRRAPGSGPFGAISRNSPAYGLGLGIGPGRTTAARSAAPASDAPALALAPGRAKPTRRSKALSKVQKLRDRSRAAGQGDPMILSVPLPRSLRAVLESISEGLVESHALLSETLKARYEEQWPLVRSLADVFMRYSYILKHYAAYVCHLQRALEELEEAALMERAMRGKRIKKERLSHTVGLGRTISALEAAALERGHGGLSIFVSMPFQRLLKYPLLFQNLLFHTDPSTHEFESTVAMVVEVERLVRSIEDEKVNAEERDKTRDAFARIEGLTDRQVLRPRADRTLIEEKALYDESQRRTVSESAPKELGGNLTDTSDHEGPSGSGAETPSKLTLNRWSASPGLRAALRSKRSYRRLSDFLSAEEKNGPATKAPSMGSKKDLWLVRFSDVEIKCQRVGVTALPMVSSAALTVNGSSTADANAAAGTAAAEESAEMAFARRSKESKERLKALRSTTLRAKTRNLYRFISVVAWRTAARQTGAAGAELDGGLDGLPTSHEVDEEGEDDDYSDGDSDSGSSDADSNTSTSSGDEADGGYASPERYVRQSKLSFTYWGDRVEPRIAGRIGSGTTATASTGLVNESSVAAYRSLSGQNAGTGATSACASAANANANAAAATSGRGHAQGGNAGRGTNVAANKSVVRVGRAARPISSGSFGMSASGAPRRRAGSPMKRASLGAAGGMSSRLAEPLSASSMHSAPEAVQSAVAHMHAKQRNDKFGGRLRGLPAGMGGGTNGSPQLAQGAFPAAVSPVLGSVADATATAAAASGGSGPR